MFTISYGKNTEAKFKKSWRICLQNSCIEFMRIYGDMSKEEFFELIEETLDGLEMNHTENSVTLELGLFDTVTIEVLHLTSNQATIELSF